MKCSPRRNCDAKTPAPRSSWPRLNEVQFPKELRQKENTRRWHVPWGLNEVQFPKELRRWLVRVGLDG